MSNVVKQNDNLMDDHTMGCEKLQKINELLKKEVVSSEIISTTLLSSSNKKRLE